MTRLADKLRAIRVFNTHEMLVRFGDDRDVAVSYDMGGGRSVTPPRTQVWSAIFKTDPAAAWYHGNKTFIGKRAVSMPEAKTWAEKTYGIKEWAPCPMIRGTYIPKRVLDRAKVAVAAPEDRR